MSHLESHHFQELIVSCGTVYGYSATRSFMYPVTTAEEETCQLMHPSQSIASEVTE